MERRANLDTARGIACVLLVFYHAVGIGPESGLRLPPSSGYSVLNDALAYVRMPLFTFLSGVVYALRPVSLASLSRFAEAKVKRLLVPFLTITVLFTVMQRLIPGTNTSLEWVQIPRALLWPYGHLWFLLGLAWVFAAVAALDALKALEKPGHCLILFMAGALLFELHYGPIGVLAWNRSFYLLPFFVAGLMLTRFGVKWALICAPASLLSLNWPILIGVIFCTMLLSWLPAVAILARIGIFSYSIYLLHVFGTASMRMLLMRIGVETVPLLLVFITAAGIALPIGAHLALARIPFAGRALLGVWKPFAPATPRTKGDVAR